MIPSEKSKSAAFYLTAAVISMLCCAQTTHCLWLKKTVRRLEEEPTKAPVEVTETPKGRIVFGRVFEREAAGKSQDVDGAGHTNAGDDRFYQADQPGRRTSSWALSEWNLVVPMLFSLFVFFLFLNCPADQKDTNAMPLPGWREKHGEICFPTSSVPGITWSSEQWDQGPLMLTLNKVN